jgi:His-Xaa-Ser system radical SAM maturase HxsC
VITGGEPTILGDKFFRLVSTIKAYLPTTSVHVLSNGRTFKDVTLAQKLASIAHPDLMLGIPLYSDVASLHDFVVQADGAFDETIAGILNLKRYGQRIELRVVIHAQTYKRLPQLAEFIVRNLQFVDQVSLMGLEPTGFALANLSEMWIDPYDYQNELERAVEILCHGKVKALIFNHQLCVLKSSLRQFAVKSISDWKREYVAECQGCPAAHGECGGFFSSSLRKHSAHIHPLEFAGSA